MKKFIMLVGLPGSGKSTTAATLAAETGAKIVSPDKIREELYGNESIQGDPKLVFATAKARIKQLIKEDYSVIYDATNLQQKWRGDILEILPSGVSAEAIIINTPLEECLQRNALRDKHVPEHVIKNMHNNMEFPTWEEFKKISILIKDEIVEVPHKHDGGMISIFIEDQKFFKEEAIFDEEDEEWYDVPSKISFSEYLRIFKDMYMHSENIKEERLKEEEKEKATLMEAEALEADRIQNNIPRDWYFEFMTWNGRKHSGQVSAVTEAEAEEKAWGEHAKFTSGWKNPDDYLGSELLEIY